MKKIEFDINENNKLFFLPEYNRFALNKINSEIEPDLYDTSLVKLRLEISHKCNGRCKYCLVFGNNVENFETLDIKEFWKEFSNKDWFKNLRSIFIIGGEPLLFFKEISFILDNFNGRVSFSTNGTLLTEEMVKKFSKSNVSVYISLDGPTFKDNINRVYTDGKYMYSDIMKGINLLQQYDVKFGIFMVASKETIHKAKDMILKLDEKYSPSRIGYSLPHWASNYQNEDLAEEFRDVLIELYKNRKKIKADIPQMSWRINPLREGKVKKFSCGLHTTQTTILPDKSFVRCSKIDNINDNLKEIFTNKLLDKNSPIELAKNENSCCSRCIALACCGGGCPFDGMKRFKCLTDKRECVITPALIKVAINDIVDAFRNGKVQLKDGLIDPKIIDKILWS